MALRIVPFGRANPIIPVRESLCLRSSSYALVGQGPIRIPPLFPFPSAPFPRNVKEDGTLELYYLSAYCLPKILLLQLPTKGRPSLYLGLRLASYIDLENRLVVVRIKELILHVVAMEVGPVAAL
ncbi:hypothetical protein L1987_78383 [Smallanthus sonchifolius]|uniref:Uncharacterized protein n=1 Tax=Smallanthus sonchifolius TaxID=185202 RepID=A0ACB8ZD16_9ASTR|nr:hypothetical protein L1987_78383 [Smallanthus sonchifolius]